MPTNLNQLVYDIIVSHEHELISEENIKKLSAEIVDSIMNVLEGDDQIEEFEEDNITLFLSDPTLIDASDDNYCSCGCDCDENDEIEYPMDDCTTLENKPFSN